jgi:hypothetical protein
MINTTKDVAFLEQSFNQLPTEGKRGLREFLKSLVSLQRSVLERIPSVTETSNRNGEGENNK